MLNVRTFKGDSAKPIYSLHERARLCRFRVIVCRFPISTRLLLQRSLRRHSNRTRGVGGNPPHVVFPGYGNTVLSRCPGFRQTSGQHRVRDACGSRSGRPTRLRATWSWKRLGGDQANDGPAPSIRRSLSNNQSECTHRTGGPSTRWWPANLMTSERLDGAEHPPRMAVEMDRQVTGLLNEMGRCDERGSRSKTNSTRLPHTMNTT